MRLNQPDNDSNHLPERTKNPVEQIPSSFDKFIFPKNDEILSVTYALQRTPALQSLQNEDPDHISPETRKLSADFHILLERWAEKGENVDQKILNKIKVDIEMAKLYFEAAFAENGDFKGEYVNSAMDCLDAALEQLYNNITDYSKPTNEYENQYSKLHNGILEIIECIERDM